jgi:prevent-host-death family protein
MGADGKISRTVRGLDTGHKIWSGHERENHGQAEICSPLRLTFRRVLKRVAAHAILVSMTSTKKNLTGRWPLQDAKAHFSELVRRVRSDGPQLVTVHGRDEVVVVAVEEFRRLKGDRTGAALIAALQESPYRDIDLEPRRERLPVRDVKL